MLSFEPEAGPKKNLRLGRFSLKAAVGANLALATAYFIATQLYWQGGRDFLAVGAFFLFAGLALASLVTGAISWGTQAGRLGILIVLSILPFATVALLQQRYLNFSLPGYRRPVPVSAAPAPARRVPSTTVYFSPWGRGTDAIVREINAARQTIRVQAYYFTSAPIASALRDAHKRGVDVVVLLDKSQQSNRYSSATFLYNSGIDTRIDASHTIAHNKIILIDDSVVLTGSFNFTAAAEENNAENLLVIRDADLATRYTRNWQTHAQHARAYVPPVGAGVPPERSDSATPFTFKREKPIRELTGVWWGTFGYASRGSFSATCTMKARIRANGDLRGVFRMDTESDTRNADPDKLGPQDSGTVTGHIVLEAGTGHPLLSNIRLNYRPGVSSKGFTPDNTTLPASFYLEDQPDKLRVQWDQWGAHLNYLSP